MSKYLIKNDLRERLKQIHAFKRETIEIIRRLVKLFFKYGGRLSNT
jgi:hypothetical protein